MAFLAGLLGTAGGASALGTLGGAAEAASTAAPAVGMAASGGGKHGKGAGAAPASSPGLLPPNPGSLPAPGALGSAGALGGGATGPSTLGVGMTGAGTGAGLGAFPPSSPTPSLGELTAVPELTPPGSVPGLTMGTRPGGLMSPLASPTPPLGGGGGPFTQFLQSRYGIQPGSGGGWGNLVKEFLKNRAGIRQNPQLGNMG